MTKNKNFLKNKNKTYERKDLVRSYKRNEEVKTKNENKL